MKNELGFSEGILGVGAALDGSVSHHYGPTISIGEIKATSVSLQSLSPHIDPIALDASGQAGLAAFHLRQSAAYRTIKAARPHDGVAWDHGGAAGLLPPHPPEAIERAMGLTGRAMSAAAAAGAPTSAQLTGKVAVGIVIVSGPDTLAFSADERTKVIAEVQNGLSWLGNQIATVSGAPVSFYYDIQNVTLTLVDDPDGADKEGYWRTPTMTKLGYANPGAYVEHLRTTLGTDWAYCAFFVKYSQTWFAYAYPGGPYLCMQYSNDGWGPDNIDRVFAHESGHIFNAPDEYSAANCTCTSTFGKYGVRNANCQSCAPGGGVDCIMKGNSWATCKYTPWHYGCPCLTSEWGSSDMGQGSGAVSWLSGDINGDGRAEVIQLWSNGGRLGMIIYGWNGTAMTTLWASGDMGQGAGAVSWLIGDVNKDGKAEIIQQWNNNGRLGMIVYHWTGTAMTTLWATGDIGQGSGAVSWLIGDVNNDGKAEILQQWNNNGRLGMIVYHWTGTAMTTLWGTGDIGQGSGAVSWLIGDVNKDGKAEILQQWSNNGRLGMIVYHWTGTAMATLWGTGDIGQGSGAVSWLIGDVNKDGQAEVLQQWNNNGRLGMIVYRWTGSAMSTLWATGDIGQGSGAVSWLIGDVLGTGAAGIVQQWSNGGRLGTILYGWTGTAMKTLFGSADMGQGSGAVSWLIGDVVGKGCAQVVQQWSNGGRLGTILYNVPPT